MGCLPQLKFCCCGCSLRTSVLIIGCISVIGGAIGLSMSRSQRYNGYDYESALDHKVQFLSKALSFLDIVAAILLLIGAHKNKMSFLKPYLLLGLIETVYLFIITMIYLCIGSEYDDETIEEFEEYRHKDFSDDEKRYFKTALKVRSVTVIAVFCIAIPICLYFLLKSYYNVLKNGDPSNSNGQVLSTVGTAPGLPPSCMNDVEAQMSYNPSSFISNHLLVDVVNTASPPYPNTPPPYPADEPPTYPANINAVQLPYGKTGL